MLVFRTVDITRFRINKDEKQKESLNLFRIRMQRKQMYLDQEVIANKSIFEPRKITASSLPQVGWSY